MSMHTLRLSTTLALIACSGGAMAMESPIVGPRAMGMGGVGTACADDYVVQYYNPGLYGFFGKAGKDKERAPADNQDLRRKSFGLGLDLTIGGRVGGDLVTYADQFSDIDVNRLKTLGTTANPLAVQDVIRVASAVGRLQPGRDNVTTDFNSGLGMRIGSFGIGVRGYGEATAWADNIDLRNLGLNGNSVLSLADRIITANAGLSPAVANYQPRYFSAAQYQAIVGTLQQYSSAASSQLAAQILDQQSLLTGLAPDTANDVYATLVGNGTYWNPGVLNAFMIGAPIASNYTMISVSGLAVGEAAVSYGYAFNDYISVGATGKLLVGRVYGYPWYPFRDNRDYEDILKDARDQYQQTVTGTIDIGIMARMKWLQLGIIGRNLTAPTFKGPTVYGVKFDDQTLEPTCTAGLAFIPHPTLTLSGDIDLIEQETTRSGYETQYVRGGLEWDAFRFLALRGGVSQNLKETDVGLMYHAGVGLNLWAVRIDVSGMVASETVIYDGEEVPREARAAFALATDW